MQLLISPDIAERNWLLCKGEFSLRNEEAYERHLHKLYKIVKIIRRGVKCGNCSPQKIKWYYRQIYKEEPLWF